MTMGGIEEHFALYLISLYRRRIFWRSAESSPKLPQKYDFQFKTRHKASQFSQFFKGAIKLLSKESLKKIVWNHEFSKSFSRLEMV